MKNTIVVILVIISLVTTIAVAESKEPSYMTYSLSRMTALNEKDNPSTVDVELCLQYTEIYARLLNLCAIEMTAVTSDTPPELDGLEELLETLETIREMYDMGLQSSDEVISGLVEGIVGE